MQSMIMRRCEMFLLSTGVLVSSSRISTLTYATALWSVTLLCAVADESEVTGDQVKPPDA